MDELLLEDQKGSAHKILVSFHSLNHLHLFLSHILPPGSASINN